MKHQIKLKPFHAETIALIYQDVKSAQKLALELSTEGNLEPIIRADFRIIAEDLKKPLTRIEKRIPKENKEIFNTQIKETDALRLDNIRALFVRMTPDKQEMAEMLMQGVLKGEVELDLTEKM